MPQRVPILYLILGVLVVVAVVPLWFYGAKVVEINRDKLETNEKLLQSTIISSLKGDIVQRQAKLDAMLSNLTSAIQIASGGNLTADHVNAPELRALLEQFVSSDPDVAYATLLNAEQKGIVAGRINELDPFMNRELEHGFSAAWEHREYAGHPLAQGAGKNGRTIMLVSVPVIAGGRFIGVICVFVDLQFLIERLREASQNGLEAYVVDRQGRLVAGADPKYPTGQDMTRFEIVKNFVEQGRRNVVATVEFTTQQDGRNVAMLGTYSPVAQLGWAVVAQKTRASAYASIDEMQRTARWLAIFAVVMSIMVSVWAARKITTPLETLTESSRAIARGDFSRRVELKSRTEIGELAQTFNTMTDDLERFVYDLK